MVYADVFRSPATGGRPIRPLSAGASRYRPSRNTEEKRIIMVFGFYQFDSRNWVPQISSAAADETWDCSVILLRRFHRLRQRRHYFKQIANDPIIRDFEDRRLGILVDGHDAL